MFIVNILIFKAKIHDLSLKTITSIKQIEMKHFTPFVSDIFTNLSSL